MKAFMARTRGSPGSRQKQGRSRMNGRRQKKEEERRRFLHVLITWYMYYIHAAVLTRFLRTLRLQLIHPPHSFLEELTKMEKDMWLLSDVITLVTLV